MPHKRKASKARAGDEPDREARITATKKAVAAAAARVVAARGFADTTLRDIAREAQCTTGLLMHHFRDKDDLLVFSLGELYEELNRQITNVASSKGPLEGVMAAISYLLPLDAKRKAEGKVWLNFLGRALYNPDLAAEHRRRYASLGELVKRLLEEAVESGLVRADVDLDLEADALVALVVGVGTDALLDQKRLPPARQLAILEVHLARLAPSNEATKPIPKKR
jgi:AcrR family transcriptional regulator